jgi:DNA-binding Lrp family transcriptional regulator
MSEKDIANIVETAKSKGTFKILDAIRDRAYPTQDVDIFLDEDVAFLASQVDAEIKELNKSLDLSASDEAIIKELTEELDALIAKRNELVETMGGSKYIFTITGISEGKREDLYNKSIEEFPMEYEKSKNPFSGQEEKTEVENIARNRFFTDLLWAAHITKIQSPDGSEQVGINSDEATELRRSLPLASSARISEAIENIRTATTVFMMTADEDFLAKS